MIFIFITGLIDLVIGTIDMELDFDKYTYLWFIASVTKFIIYYISCEIDNLRKKITILLSLARNDRENDPKE